LKDNTPLEITYYTDPLCCWSWAFEPQWRRLRYEFSGRIKWRYRMGGMLPDWNSFTDPLNSVQRPVQMGPVWMEARHTSGMPMEDKVWFLDPPASSYQACIAVKCAGLQSAEAAEWYLRKVREAVMLHAKNISRREVLLEVASTLQLDKPHLFDEKRFREDLENDSGHDPFREDLEQARYHRIGRFPTLTIVKPGGAGVIITGYRPYPVLLEAVKQVDPSLQPTHPEVEVEGFRKYWGEVLDREAEECSVAYSW
jgi:predicted DsbA family dithiol-disulfide isomerase